MIKCQKCGTENPDSAKFCVKCGAKLNHSANSQPTNGNFTICPNCGHKNVKGAKFCMKCGYRFTGNANQDQDMSRPYSREALHDQSHVSTNPQPQQPQMNRTQSQFRPQQQNQAAPNYSQQWQNANQHLNNFQAYSNNYFAWFKDTLMHPLAHHHNASPYFGMVSFLISAVLIWVASLVGPSLTNTGNVEEDVTDLITGGSSLEVFKNNWRSASTPITMLVLSIISFALLIGIAYFGYQLVANHKENIFSFSNRFASITNVLIPLSVLLIVSVLIDKAVLVDVVSNAVNITMLIGFIVMIVTAGSKKTNNWMNGVYVAVIAGVVYAFVLPLFTAIAGIIMG